MASEKAKQVAEALVIKADYFGEGDWVLSIRPKDAPAWNAVPFTHCMSEATAKVLERETPLLLPDLLTVALNVAAIQEGGGQ